MKTQVTKPSVMISLSWGCKLLVPAANAGALIDLLGKCQFVDSEYISAVPGYGIPEGANVYVTRDAPSEMLLGTFEVMGRKDYDQLRQEIATYKEAEKLAAEQGVTSHE